ncbi:hypothetical protein D3C75_754310 [compost metagenome]
MKHGIPKPHVPVGDPVRGGPVLLHPGFGSQGVHLHNRCAFLQQTVHGRVRKLGQTETGGDPLRHRFLDGNGQPGLRPGNGFLTAPAKGNRESMLLPGQHHPVAGL